MILDCNIQCFNADEVEKGAAVRNEWFPAKIDLMEVAAVKAYSTDEMEIDESKAVLYMRGTVDAFIVDVPYIEAAAKFEKSREYRFPLAYNLAQ